VLCYYVDDKVWDCERVCALEGNMRGGLSSTHYGLSIHSRRHIEWYRSVVKRRVRGRGRG
jgi:hypothetical protein